MSVFNRLRSSSKVEANKISKKWRNKEKEKEEEFKKEIRIKKIGWTLEYERKINKNKG